MFVTSKCLLNEGWIDKFMNDRRPSACHDFPLHNLVCAVIQMGWNSSFVSSGQRCKRKISRQINFPRGILIFLYTAVRIPQMLLEHFYPKAAWTVHISQMLDVTDRPSIQSLTFESRSVGAEESLCPEGTCTFKLNSKILQVFIWAISYHLVINWD